MWSLTVQGGNHWWPLGVLGRPLGSPRSRPLGGPYHSKVETNLLWPPWGIFKVSKVFFIAWRPLGGQVIPSGLDGHQVDFSKFFFFWGPKNHLVATMWFLFFRKNHLVATKWSFAVQVTLRNKKTKKKTIWWPLDGFQAKRKNPT